LSGTRYLAFDYGTRRIGVAVGERATRTAHGIVTVAMGRAGADWKHIAALIEEWRPDTLVIGLPLAMDGHETAMSRDSRRFGAALGRRHALPVEWMDERLSSDDAEHRLRAATAPGRRISRRRIRRRDQVAAQLILESYLEQQRNPP
jgi:putative Holliday junction resolvase